MCDVNGDLFEQLYNRYYQMCYRFILSKVQDPWTAEDLLSEVFMKIYRHKDEINDINKSGSWVIKIANNTVIDFYRKNSKVDFSDEIDCEAVCEKGYDRIIVKDEFIDVTRNLPGDIKKLLNMRFFQELKFQDIGKLLNMTEASAKRRVYKALRTARELYDYNLKNA